MLAIGGKATEIPNGQTGILQKMTEIKEICEFCFVNAGDIVESVD